MAYVDARDRALKWFASETGCPPLRQRWDRRLDGLGEDPFGDPYRPSDARIEPVTYPEVVVLTGLFASPALARAQPPARRSGAGAWHRSSEMGGDPEDSAELSHVMPIAVRGLVSLMKVDLLLG
jgi:hypothetical protein